MAAYTNLRDRLWDTTTTTGTGTVTLSNTPPETAYEGCYTAYGGSADFWYCITDGTDWEVGRGTFSGTNPGTLTRDTIYGSSNSDALVNFGAGTKDVFGVYPAYEFIKLQVFASTKTYNGAGNNNPIPDATPIANGDYSLAIGDGAYSYEDGGVAIGHEAVTGQTDGASTEPHAVAIGTAAKAYEHSNIAIGNTSVAGVAAGTTASAAIAIGYYAEATSTYTTAVGCLANAFGGSSVAIGDTATANETNNIAIGTDTITGQTSGGGTETGVVAIGNTARAYEAGCIAIGSSSIAGDQTTSNSPYSVAIGGSAKAGNNNNATPTDGYAVAIGYLATAYEQYGIAIGSQATAGSSTAAGYTNAIAIGGSSNIQAQYGVGLGQQTTVYGQYGVAVGYDADARELHSICIGDGQAGQTNGGANANYAVAIGYLARASETSCIALGRSALVGNTTGTAYPYGIGIGDGVAVTGTQSTAIGYQASAANVHYAIAIGPECDVEGDYSIAMGTLTEVRERYAIGIGYSVRTGQITDGTGHPNIVAIGYDNNAYEGYAICLGSSNTIGAATGTNAEYNTAIGHGISMTGFEGAWALGRGVTIKRDHEWVKGIDPAVSDARRGDMGMSITTTDTTPTKLKLNEAGLDHITLGTHDCFAFTALVVGCSATAGKKAGYYIEGVAYRDTGNVAWVASSPTITALGEGDAAMDCTMGLDTTNQGIYIEVTGLTSTTIQWAADIRFVEVDT